MAEPFKEHDKFYAWLGGQPKNIVITLATRAALRSVPAFVSLLKGDTKLKEHDTIILHSFWALAITVLLSKELVADLASLSTLRSVNSLASHNTFTSGERAHAAGEHPSAGVAFGVRNLSNTILSDKTDVVFSSAKYSMNGAAVAAGAAITGASTLANIQNYSDGDLIVSGIKAIHLTEYPLWEKELPKNIFKSWERLKIYLLGLDQDWDVWTDWYDYLLTRDPKLAVKIGYSEEVEIGLDPEHGQYGRVTLPEEYYQDPAKTNAAIKEIIEAYKKRQESLEQDPTVETFDITPDGEISLSTDTIGAGLLAEPSQKDWYEELRDAVEDAQTLGQNKLGSAARPLSRFADALPENIEHAKVAKLWPRANRLRRLIKRSNAIPDGEFDPDRLDPDAADSLDTIVEVYNNLRIGDPSLMAADDNAISPQDAEEIISEIEEIQPFLEEVLAEADIEPEAAETLQEIVDLDVNDITLQSDIMGRLEVAEKKKRIRNFAASVVRYVRSEPHKAAGAVFLTEAASKYAEQLATILGVAFRLF